jgi:Ala-tRNA(Pro) deacylase
MKQYEIVYDTLKQMGIEYDVVEHPPALTTEEADNYIINKEGVRSKTMFLRNRKTTAYYLIIMDGAKRLDMKMLDSSLGEKGMRFCSEENLMAKMSLPPGTVSLFGLINNTDRDIKVCLDSGILKERIITFHPNDNSKTIFISVEDMCTFINSLGYEYSVLEL